MTPRRTHRSFILVATALSLVALAAWRLAARSYRIPVGPSDATRLDDGAEPAAVDVERTGAGLAASPFESDESPAIRRAPPGGAGRLVFLRSKDGTSVADRMWTLTPAGRAAEAGPPVVVRADDDSAVAAAPGSWKANDPEGRFWTLDDLLEVESGATTTAFVQERGRVAFLATDLAGSPLAGVRGVWTPRAVLLRLATGVAAAWRAGLDDALTTRTSGVDGLIVFDGVAGESGAASFFADGFEPTTRDITFALDAAIPVALAPSATPERRLAVYGASDGAPLAGVSLRLCSGAPLAAAPPGSNVVSVPRGASLDDEIVVLASDAFPGRVRLGSLRDDRVDAPQVCRVAVRLRGGRPSALGTIVEGDVLGTPGEPLGVEPAPIPADGVVCWEWPRGARVRFFSWDDRGSGREAEIVLADAQVEVVLDAEEGASPLEVRVLGSGGAPIPEARGRARGGERERKAVADAAGILRFPEPAEISWFFVDAPGYARASFMRRGPAGTGAATSPVDVVLRPACDVPVVVRDGGGAPVTGWAVAVARRSAPDADAVAAVSSIDDAWQAARPSWIAGVTDDDGRFTARGVAIGRIDVELTPPVALMDVQRASRRLCGEWRRDLVADGAELLLVVERSRRVALRVSEASTGLAVSSFSVVDAAREARFDVRGAVWQGWARPDATLTIAAPNVGSATVSVADIPSDRIFDVRIPSTLMTTVEIRDLPPDVDARGYVVQVMKRGPDGTLFFAARLPLDLGTTAPHRFCLPFEGEHAVSVVGARTTASGALVFEPRLQPWVHGGVLVFRARRP
ncbi:MAG TPA: hypothetical protein VEI02_17075 [Planctomycetota bacterium]|nr:hypothetical protein [Planctomycetota bacterium]